MHEAPDNRTLYLRPDLAVIRMATGVQLRAGDEEIHVIETDSPELVERLLHLLANGCGCCTLYDRVGEANRDLIDEVIVQLDAAGMLLDQPIEPSDAIARYLSHFVKDGARASLERFGSVAVAGRGKCVELLGRATREHGIDVIPMDTDSLVERVESSGVDAIVCIWEQPDLRRVMDVNAVACRGRLPCLFVDLSHGQHVTVGPCYVPGEGACYHCFRHRWRENTASPEEFEAAESTMLRNGQPLPAYGILPAFRYVAVGLACGELFALLAEHRPLRTLNCTVTVDPDGMKLWTEPCWQIPWCPICGSEG
jgi:bacteriocin biosynthesis cyclodehydratase domain-containing protein